MASPQCIAGCVGALSPMLPRGHVLGLGSNVLDTFFRVRAFPASGGKGYSADPEQLWQGTLVGGVTLNHLAWASLLGVPTGLLALQGDDATGQQIRAKMENLGISTKQVVVDSAYTTACSHIYLDDFGERTIIMASGSTANLTGEVFDARFRDFVFDAGLVTAEVCQVPLSSIDRLFEAANHARIISCLDVDVPPSVASGEARLGTLCELLSIASSCTVLKPTISSAAELLAVATTYGESADPAASGVHVENTPDQVAGQIQTAFKTSLVVVTDGSRGCGFAVETADGSVQTLAVPAHGHVMQRDSTGAGDAFFGGLVAAIYHLGLPSNKNDLQVAGTIAGALGAACCEVLGALPDETSSARVRTLLPPQYHSWIRSEKI